jgi:hypothetical protein
MGANQHQPADEAEGAFYGQRQNKPDLKPSNALAYLKNAHAKPIVECIPKLLSGGEWYDQAYNFEG